MSERLRDHERVPDRETVLALLPRLVVSALAGVAGVVGSYAVTGFAPEFVVAPVDTKLALVMPGQAITFAITVLGNLGQKLNLLTAIGLTVAGFAAFALVGRAVGDRTTQAAGPAVTGVLAWAATTLLTGAPYMALGAAVPPVVVMALADGLRAAPVDERISEPRREVLGTVGAVALFGGGGYLLGNRRSSAGGGGESLNLNSTGGSTSGSAGSTNSTGTDTSGTSQIQNWLDDADTKSLGVTGIEPLVSEDFYNVDINSVDPDINKDDWSLSVTGAVEEEVTIDYDELREMASENRFVTLRCVGEGLNGKKMDTALWTGVPIMDIVDKATPTSDCNCVMFRADDDYYEEFPTEAMQDGMLAYGMNGNTLPRSHGYPVRALIPGHWGEINVKWIDEIELLNKEMDGYWEKKGWHGTGPVNTVAKLHATNDLDDGTKQVAGHAYAGVRGIQKVEVSTDGGSTWSEATLSDPLPGREGYEKAQDAWRQWKYEYEPPSGEHTVVVRATDGNGDLQTEEDSGSYPSGATGWVEKTIK